MLDQLPTRGTRMFPQVGNPSREAHERGAELVRRLARHRHPQAIARGGEALAVGPRREPPQAQEHGALERGELGELHGHGERAVVDGADPGLDERRVHRVEPRDPVAQPRRVVRPGDVGRHVVHRRDPPRRVGDGDGDAERPYLRGEVEQRVGRGVGARVVQASEHAPQQAARVARVVAQVPRHHPRVADRDAAQQQREHHHRAGARPAAQVAIRHRGEPDGRFRDRAPGRPES